MIILLTVDLRARISFVEERELHRTVNIFPVIQCLVWVFIGLIGLIYLNELMRYVWRDADMSSMLTEPCKLKSVVVGVHFQRQLQC